MENKTPNQQYAKVQRAPKGLVLSQWFTDAEVRKEPEEAQKVVVAGLVEARPIKDYPDSPFKKAFAVLKGEFSTLFRTSIWATLFTLPFIVLVAWFAGYFEELQLGGLYNFMSGIGVGYNPGEVDSISRSVASLYWDVKAPIYMMVAACLLIGAIGIGGQFYCAKRSYFQDYYKKTVTTYWMGFKKHCLKYFLYAIVDILIAAALTISIVYLLKQKTLGLATAGTYCIPIFTWIIGAPLLTIPMVMMSIAASYELTFAQTFKNAIVIILNSPFIVAIVGIISAAPLLICLAGNIPAVIVYAVMVIIGSNLLSLVWIALGNSCMNKCKERLHVTQKQALQAQRQAQKSAKKNNPYQGGSASGAQKKKKQVKVPYQDPRKKKKK